MISSDRPTDWISSRSAISSAARTQASIESGSAMTMRAETWALSAPSQLGSARKSDRCALRMA